MQFDNGQLILDEAERSLLSAASMKEINPQYPAAYFIGSLAEMKLEAEEYIKQIELKQDRDKRDAMKIEITRLLIETVDSLTEKGYAAAEASGKSILWQ
jgi:hypothetical protein